MSTFQQKVAISASSALLFAVINLAQVYKLTDQLLPFDTVNKNGCPTASGKIVHALVFFLLTLLSMGNPAKDTAMKIRHSLYATLIFYALSSRAMFQTTARLVSSDIANQAGCPTLMGVVLHAVVYFLAVLGVMYL